MGLARLIGASEAVQGAAPSWGPCSGTRALLIGLSRTKRLQCFKLELSECLKTTTSKRHLNKKPPLNLLLFYLLALSAQWINVSFVLKWAGRIWQLPVAPMQPLRSLRFAHLLKQFYTEQSCTSFSFVTADCKSKWNVINYDVNEEGKKCSFWSARPESDVCKLTDPCTHIELWRALQKQDTGIFLVHLLAGLGQKY